MANSITVFPQSDTAATILLKLAVIIQGWRLLKGGNKNFYSIAYMYYVMNKFVPSLISL